jgi:hypothetical protein
MCTGVKKAGPSIRWPGFSDTPFVQLCAAASRITAQTSGVSEARFDGAARAAAIPAHGVSVVTLLVVLQDAIAANLEAAEPIAAVTADVVPVVTLLAGIQHTVAAADGGHATRHDERSTDGAVTRSIRGSFRGDGEHLEVTGPRGEYFVDRAVPTADVLVGEGIHGWMARYDDARV